ncbi:ribonuclease P protein component [Patescibacteria group bacterium]|nr:ribonuclease P protein component [Patescibacteria group bacterium]MBU2214687.1 ribonuclease P protein component [Patescibacteria group bacterium]MBU2249982.1 ribonuclease P protein component [Patescibacteria group bacterium]
MPAKIRSLTKEKDFDRIFKQGSSYYCQVLGLKCLANEIGQNRLGIIISKKVSKKAVDRNKLKRRIKEIFRLWAEKLMPNYDFLVITLPSKNVPKRISSYQEIAEALEQTLKKLKMFK